MNDAILQNAMRLHRGGNLGEAAPLYSDILRDEPANFDALHFLGVLKAQSGDYEAAVALLDRAVVVNPASPVAFYNRGNALRDAGRLRESLASYDGALALAPEASETWSNRGAVLEELGRPGEAIASFDRALELDPTHARALINRGNALRRLHRLEEALADYGRALALDPANAVALNARGAALQDLQRFDEALAAYSSAFAIAPALPYLEGWRLHAKMHVCDWSELAAERAQLDRHVMDGKQAAAPFVLLSSSASPEVQLRGAALFSQCEYKPRLPRAKEAPRRHDRIRIAYISGEFREQATSYLTADLFECHDRSAVEIHGIATRPGDGSTMRRRIENGFDRFHDVSGRTAPDIARLIRRSEIDILVNLNGYFGAERTDVFARGPAPIQVNYLGFPGTMGVSYMDYILADATVIPMGAERFYSEKVVRLAGSYQCNDRKRAIGPAVTRRQAGLPDDGFVFCCFNSTHKVTPEIFDIWMRLLRAVADSVLWLPEANAPARANLSREAERRGVAAARLRFAPLLKLPDHLARHRLADLFLDTLPHNAHTTASDSLWAGVPVLTALGAAFAGRVAASLNRAVGLNELVTESLAGYEALALALARDPARLAALRNRLSANRETLPLFDTPRLTRHIEAAYRIMWERAERGLAPDHFAVPTDGLR